MMTFLWTKASNHNGMVNNSIQKVHNENVNHSFIDQLSRSRYGLPVIHLHTCVEDNGRGRGKGVAMDDFDSDFEVALPRGQPPKQIG